MSDTKISALTSYSTPISTDVLPIVDVTNSITKKIAFSLFNPLTTQGDLVYGGTSGVYTRLAGNTTTTKEYLSQTGNGSSSAAPVWSQIAASDLSNGVTGSGSVVLATSPTLTTPTLGVATATTINKVTITTPATGSTLTIADGKTFTANNSITIAGVDGKTLTQNKSMTFTAVDDTGVYTFPTGTKTLVATDVATLSSLTTIGTVTSGGLGTGATLGGVTMSLGSDAVGDIYAATTSNVLSRIAAVAVGQVLISKGVTTLPAWSASATLSNLICSNNAITASGNAATVPVTSRLSTVTNNSAATLTITITTTNAVDGQMLVVRVLDFSAVAQTISWVNTENSVLTTVPTTSNGSTTSPLTVMFQYNGGTSKWRCLSWT